MNNQNNQEEDRNKINKAFVNKTQLPESKQKFYWDSELKGFGLRVTPGGSKSYVVQSRINGKTTRRTIGEHGVYTAEQARIEAKELLLQMQHGKDPKLTKHEQKIKNITLVEVFEDYKRVKYQELCKNTVTLYDGIMRRCLSDWKDKEIVSLTREMVEKRLVELTNANGPKGPGRGQAGQCYRLLRSMVNFVQKRYKVNGKPILEYDPTSDLSYKRPWTENVRRQGTVKKHQLEEWFTAVMSLSNTTVRDYLLLMILTGLRRNEALMLKWDEVSLEERYIKLGATRTKNRKEHTLPLSDYLHELLTQRSQNNKDSSPYVFPSKINSATYLKDPKRIVKKLREDTGIKFMQHDLRRTFITNADDLKLSQYKLKKLLNQSVGNDVTAGYIITETERLREPMKEITDYILEQADIKKIEGIKRDEVVSNGGNTEPQEMLFLDMNKIAEICVSAAASAS